MPKVVMCQENKKAIFKLLDKCDNIEQMLNCIEQVIEVVNTHIEEISF